MILSMQVVCYELLCYGSILETKTIFKLHLRSSGSESFLAVISTIRYNLIPKCWLDLEKVPRELKMAVSTYHLNKSCSQSILVLSFAINNNAS